MQFSNGVVEELNNKAKPAAKKACGLNPFRILEFAMYHILCDLSEPNFIHKFFLRGKNDRTQI